MTQDEAQIVGLQALAWIAAQEEVMDLFLGASGATADEIKATAGEPATASAVLDFLAQRDEWVTEFATAQALRPDRVMMARAMLAGPGEMHWT